MYPGSDSRLSNAYSITHLPLSSSWLSQTPCLQKVWIALGTERGRLACWALEDILESDATLMPGLKLRPVPDSLCPALRSSFNPYSLNVEVSGLIKHFRTGSTL